MVITPSQNCWAFNFYINNQLFEIQINRLQSKRKQFCVELQNIHVTTVQNKYNQWKTILKCYKINQFKCKHIENIHWTYTKHLESLCKNILENARIHVVHNSNQTPTSIWLFKKSKSFLFLIFTFSANLFFGPWGQLRKCIRTVNPDAMGQCA